MTTQAERRRRAQGLAVSARMDLLDVSNTTRTRGAAMTSADWRELAASVQDARRRVDELAALVVQCHTVAVVSELAGQQDAAR